MGRVMESPRPSGKQPSWTQGPAMKEWEVQKASASLCCFRTKARWEKCSNWRTGQ